MENLSEMIEFISSSCIEEYCTYSFIFGSVARNVDNPKDCDLFWVTEIKPESKKWFEMKKYIQSIKDNFNNKFNLKLNITLNTLVEFNEGSDFKSRILSRQKIITKELNI